MKTSTREWVAKAEARRALKTCRVFRKEARSCLGLPPK